MYFIGKHNLLNLQLNCNILDTYKVMSVHWIHVLKKRKAKYQFLLQNKNRTFSEYFCLRIFVFSAVSPSRSRFLCCTWTWRRNSALLLSCSWGRKRSRRRGMTKWEGPIIHYAALLVIQITSFFLKWWSVDLFRISNVSVSSPREAKKELEQRNQALQIQHEETQEKNEKLRVRKGREI